MQQKTRTLLTIAFISIIVSSCQSQPHEKDIWVRYKDTTQQLYGFKDLQGNIKVSPRYWDCPTDTFRTIAFVGIPKEGWVCIDKNLNILFHPFIWDNDIDPWQSGLIRIQENKKIGFADTTGKIAIPPIYDFVTPFDQNYSAFLSGAKHTCMEDGVPDSLCEHMGWVGGVWGIINKHNDTLIPPSIDRSLFDLDVLNISSITDTKPNSFYIPLAGKNKTYYIEDVQKSFQSFLDNFLEQVEQKNTAYFQSVCFPNIACAYCLVNTNQEHDSLVKAKHYEEGSFSTALEKEEVFQTPTFIKEDFGLIFSEQAIANLRDTNVTDIFINHDYCNYLFPYTNEGLFLQYLNKQHRYYKITVYVSHYESRRARKTDAVVNQNKNLRIRYQDLYVFLKTDEGIKFIEYDRTLDGYGE